MERITELAEQYYRLISKVHHKDQDCHWSIETKWSYGEEPSFYVQHYGYLWRDETEIECQSFDEAMSVLEDILRQAIAYVSDSEEE